MQFKLSRVIFEKGKQKYQFTIFCSTQTKMLICELESVLFLMLDSGGYYLCWAYPANKKSSLEGYKYETFSLPTRSELSFQEGKNVNSQTCCRYVQWSHKLPTDNVNTRRPE